jgi:hypothetical protein
MVRLESEDSQPLVGGTIYNPLEDMSKPSHTTEFNLVNGVATIEALLVFVPSINNCRIVARFGDHYNIIQHVKCEVGPLSGAIKSIRSHVTSISLVAGTTPHDILVLPNIVGDLASSQLKELASSFTITRTNTNNNDNGNGNVPDGKGIQWHHPAILELLRDPIVASSLVPSYRLRPVPVPVPVSDHQNNNHSNPATTSETKVGTHRYTIYYKETRPQYQRLQLHDPIICTSFDIYVTPGTVLALPFRLLQRASGSIDCL